MKKLTLIFSAIILFASCNRNGEKADAFGNFEAVSTIISAESSGKLIEFNLNEGQLLEKGQIIGIIDTTSLYLNLKQVLAQKNSVSSKSSNIISQVRVIEEQKASLETERKRVANLLKDSAATQRQMDDIEGKIKVFDKQIDQVVTQNRNIFDDLKVFDAQVNILKNQISKCYIVNPFKGNVIVKYAEAFEMAVPGKPLYKISDLSVMNLKAYISETQLNEIKIGQKLKVYIDAQDGKMQEFEGTLIWISDKAEFTPKTIQTKDERINLVYAIKISVKNDGQIKIGMPAEVNFDSKEN
jgi:HlyD family secretion protein